MNERRFFVYILSNASKTLYVGMTNDLERRMNEHKQKLVPGFITQYNLTRLVYFCEFNDPREAIAYEKKLKGWIRAKKVALIEQHNPNWLDLAAAWNF